VLEEIKAMTDDGAYWGAAALTDQNGQRRVSLLVSVDGFFQEFYRFVIQDLNRPAAPEALQ
jgi:hypothetical protein